MSIETILLRPNTNNNHPPGTTSIPLSSLGLWRGQVPSVLIFPGRIDSERLELAIQTISAIYPHISGRQHKVIEAHDDQPSIHKYEVSFELSHLEISVKADDRSNRILPDSTHLFADTP